MIPKSQIYKKIEIIIKILLKYMMDIFQYVNLNFFNGYLYHKISNKEVYSRIKISQNKPKISLKDNMRLFLCQNRRNKYGITCGYILGNICNMVKELTEQRTYLYNTDGVKLIIFNPRSYMAGHKINNEIFASIAKAKICNLSSIMRYIRLEFDNYYHYDEDKPIIANNTKIINKLPEIIQDRINNMYDI